MGLKVELKAGERFILGDCLVTNGNQRTRLLIEGDTPILREKDIMTAAQADPRLHHETYFILMRDLVQAAPSAWPHVVAVSNHILAGEMYKALKCAKTLIAYEKELLDHATRGANVRRGRQADRKSA
jgi:flagellar protein FlbT